MNARALMYHDVVASGGEDSTGFPGGDAARYKLTIARFDAHLEAIASHAGCAPVTVAQLEAPDGRRASSPLLLTFDDGGVSAVMHVADRLEWRGWRGHFFITTAWIGCNGFLSRPQVRELIERGHIVGSHSHTHPLRMGRCGESRLRSEWTRSVRLLADIAGRPIASASVPGGDYTDLVGLTAADAGIRFLFTSRPTRVVGRMGPLLIIGRYAMRASTSAPTAGRVAEGKLGPLFQQRAAWEMRAVCKTVGGGVYRRLRNRILGRSDVQWGDDIGDLSEEPSELAFDRRWDAHAEPAHHRID